MTARELVAVLSAFPDDVLDAPVVFEQWYEWGEVDKVEAQMRSLTKDSESIHVVLTSTEQT